MPSLPSPLDSRLLKLQECSPEYLYNDTETNDKSLFQVFTANSDRGTITQVVAPYFL